MSALSEARARLTSRLTLLTGEGPLPRLEEALTHPSYSNETGAPDNQRLEFLGDSVLGLCTSELLSERFPDADEGALSRMRSAAVSAVALADWARRVGLGEAIAVGRGARTDRDREQMNVLADAVESVVAAVYLARGLDAARLLVGEIVSDAVAAARESGARDPKGVLQEQTQARGMGVPVYRVVDSSGPAHAPRFKVEAVIGDRVIGSGEGPSKKLASLGAAEDALTRPLE